MKIRNKKTGEIIEVGEDQLSKYGIQKAPTTPAATSGSDITGMGGGGSTGISPEQAMIANILFPKQAGIINSVYGIQKDQRDATAKAADDEKAKADAGALKDAALKAAMELRDGNYGAITGAKSPALLIPGTKPQSTLNKFKQVKSLLTLDNIKYLKGTGQISDKEQEILSSAATSLERNLSNEDFAIELDNIISNLGGSPSGVDKADTLMEKATGTVMNEGSRNPIVNLLLGGALNLTKDLAQGANVKSHQNAVDENLTQVSDMMKQYTTTTDTKKKKEIEGYLNSLLDTTISESNKDVEGFSKDVNMNPALRSLLTGVDIAGAAEIPAAITGLLGLAGKKVGKNVGQEAITTLAEGGGKDIVGEGVNLVNKARQMTPGGYLARKQGEAAVRASSTVNVDDFIKAGEKLAMKNPKAAKILEEWKPALQNIKSVPDLLEHMSEWGDVAYKMSGGTKSADRARLFNEFYKTGLNILKTEAPEVYKYRQLLRYTHELPKNLGRGLWRLFVGRAALGGLN